MDLCNQYTAQHSLTIVISSLSVKKLSTPLILGNRTENFLQEYETFSIIYGSTKCQEKFLWALKLFTWKKFHMKPSINIE